MDISLLHALQRTVIFPAGDLALVYAMQMLLPEKLPKSALFERAEAWQPYRSIVTVLL